MKTCSCVQKAFKCACFAQNMQGSFTCWFIVPQTKHLAAEMKGKGKRL